MDYNSITTQSDRGDMLYTLLDFLRLRVSYDRVAWNLQPVVLAHDVLVSCGHDAAADVWRAAVVDRTKGMARNFKKRLDDLSRKYGMQLPSIADRLGEQFVRPMAIDHLRAMVGPAMEAMRKEEGASDAFARFEEGVAPFTEAPVGVGFESPPWLEALEREVETIELGKIDDALDLPSVIKEVRLSVEEIDSQLDAMKTVEP